MVYFLSAVFQQTAESPFHTNGRAVVSDHGVLLDALGFGKPEDHILRAFHGQLGYHDKLHKNLLFVPLTE